MYGPQEDGDKVLFLVELEAIRDVCTGPWAVTGDFNLILNEVDKSNDRIDRAWLRPIWPTDPLARPDCMLRALVCELQRWSATRIGEIKAQPLMARELVLRLDIAQERR